MSRPETRRDYDAEPVRPVSMRVLGSIYALVVAVIAAIGFAVGSTITILLAALISLPASLIALPGYYVVYGLLALIPGANPSGSSGSYSCTADGHCTGSSTGDLAPWFQVTTDICGVLFLTSAALLNVFVVGTLMSRRRSVLGGPRPAEPPPRQ